MKMEKIKNAKRELALIVADIIKAENSHDEKMSKLIAEALQNYSQRQLIKALEEKGIKLSQTSIARYGAIGEAMKTGKGLNPENVLTGLRTGELLIGEVKAWGKNVPADYTKPRSEAKRKPQGTQAVSQFDAVKKNLTQAVKSAKSLTSSEKAKLQDLGLQLVTILGIVPMELDGLDLVAEIDEMIKG
jgi:predicted transcriptional regulator